MTAQDVVGTSAGIAATAGILVGVQQLTVAIRQSKASFAQQFNDRYRDVISRIPLAALLGVEYVYHPSAHEDDGIRRAFYDYFELCEEELFYRDAGKVDKNTWTEWQFGISTNLAHPAFSAAWVDLSEAAPDQFNRLRSLVQDLRS